jgi:hypothetical protein
MRRLRDRFPRNLKAVLGLEVLEDRVPVSENIGMLAMLATAGEAAALASTARTLPNSSRDGGWSPREVTPTQRIALITAKATPPAPVHQPAVVQPPAADFHTALQVTGLGDDPSAGLDQAAVELVGAFPVPPRHQPPLFDSGSGRLAGPAFDSGSGVSFSPDAWTTPVGSDSSTGSPFLASSSSAFDAVAAPLTAAPTGAPVTAPANPVPPPPNPQTNGPGNGPGDDHHHQPPGGKGRNQGDPLYVVDANNNLYLANNSTVHDFSTWYVDLFAQVSGATVKTDGTGYTWTYSSAPDLKTSTVSGQGTYHFHFQWDSFTDSSPHSDTIALQTTNTDGTHQNATLYFEVVPTNNPAWVANSSRPTTIPTLPLLVPPDAVEPGQETVTDAAYSLGEETGEVMTSFTLPSYHPAVAPLQLEYSSLAANPRPIFTEYYQLSQPVQSNSTVTATLKFNNEQITTTYDTHTLNQGDILDIALQGDATGLTSTSRLTYEIDVTESSTAQPPVTGSVDIISPSGNPFGAGWSLAGLEQVFPVSGGVILGMGNGQSLWFANGSMTGTFVTPPGDFSTLTQDTSSPNAYHRTLKDGTQINFSSAGYQTSLDDVISDQTFTYTYNGSNQLIVGILV